MPDKTAPKQQIGVPFKPGQSGNPKGRPKGSRNKLQERFLADMKDAWEKRGVEAIEKMITDKPGDFVKVVASILPKETNLTINDHSEMTDDELAERVRSLATQLAPFLIDGTGGAEAGNGIAAGKEKPPHIH